MHLAFKVCNERGRQAEQLVDPVVVDRDMPGPVDHEQALVHVFEGGLHQSGLIGQLPRALLDPAFQLLLGSQQIPGLFRDFPGGGGDRLADDIGFQDRRGGGAIDLPARHPFRNGFEEALECPGDDARNPPDQRRSRDRKREEDQQHDRERPVQRGFHRRFLDADADEPARALQAFIEAEHGNTLRVRSGVASTRASRGAKARKLLARELLRTHRARDDPASAIGDRGKIWRRQSRLRHQIREVGWAIHHREHRGNDIGFDHRHGNGDGQISPLRRNQA